MSDLYGFNSIQPITDDYYTDGYLDEFARLDHQHPLSTTLAKKIPSYGMGNPPAVIGPNGKTYYDTVNKRLWMSDGVGWIVMSEPLQTYTPVWNGITVNNGINNGFYHRSDGYIDVDLRLIFGSTTAMAAVTFVNVTLPVVPAVAFRSAFGVGLGQAAGAGTTGTSNDATGSTTVQILYLVSTAVGTAINWGNITNLIPWNWTNGDSMHVTGRYPMTTRYS